MEVLWLAPGKIFPKIPEKAQSMKKQIKICDYVKKFKCPYIGKSHKNNTMQKTQWEK